MANSSDFVKWCYTIFLHLFLLNFIYVRNIYFIYFRNKKKIFVPIKVWYITSYILIKYKVWKSSWTDPIPKIWTNVQFCGPKTSWSSWELSAKYMVKLACVIIIWWIWTYNVAWWLGFTPQMIIRPNFKIVCSMKLIAFNTAEWVCPHCIYIYGCCLTYKELFSLI